MSFLTLLGLKNSNFKQQDSLHLFNTLSGKKEVFVPLYDKKVRMYNCGPTVYDYIHIGNLRAYVFSDILKRTLLYKGFKVKQVVNITDVGHLTSDADVGEDKLEKRAREKKKKAQEIADEVTVAFLRDIERLNIDTSTILFPKATEHIAEQIAFIKTLEEKGYTYKTKDGIYFDTSLFPEYGKLGNIDLAGLKEGARVAKRAGKKHPTDFALWKFSHPLLRNSASSPHKSAVAKRQQEWESPWGVGFPGWHIECSAMAMKHLGRQLDIHTGGIDHIPIHHNNEIAQSEAVFGKQFVRYWLHNAFITINGTKIAKSLGNTIYISDIVDRGLHPLSLRYWFLTGHYRSPINFTWEALTAAHTALVRLHRHIVEDFGVAEDGIVDRAYRHRFSAAVCDDLDTPKAIALVWELVKDESVSNKDKRATLLDFDRVLGLGLLKTNEQFLQELLGSEKPLTPEEIPDKVKNLLDEREESRHNKEWHKADQLRDDIQKEGYEIDDTDEGTQIRKISVH